MVQVDEQFMQEVGLAQMPMAQKRAFMEHAQEELEVRVGQSVGAYLTDEQLLQFEQIAEPVEAAKWLERFVPNFREIVNGIFQNFKQELLRERQKILG